MKKYNMLFFIIIIILIITGCTKDINKTVSNEGVSNTKKQITNNKNNNDSNTLKQTENKSTENIINKNKEIDAGEIDNRFSNEKNNKGGISIVIKNTNLVDYVIEDNYAYLMVVDPLQSNKMECVKYNTDTQKTTVLYKTIHDTFINVYTHFLKKKNNSYLMIDLQDKIIVIDTDKNVVEKEINLPKDVLYADINYKGNQLCYYKKSKLYRSNTDFSNEVLLKEYVGDTEDTVQPCWSYNDEKIAYFNDYQVEVIDIHGKLQESLPRAARYVKWTRDDNALLIGTNGGGTKIDLKNKVVHTTYSVDSAYREQGYTINLLDDFSNEVWYSGVNDLLAFKIRTSGSECDAIGVFDGENLSIKKETRLPKLVRWTSKANKVAVLYEEKEQQQLCIMNVKDDEFKIRKTILCEPVEKNYYISDNDEVNDNGKWIIIGEGRQNEDVVRVNLDTGEQCMIATNVNTVTQSLKKWNYVWGYDGIYLINYNGKEKHHIVSSDKHFSYFRPIDNGLIFKSWDNIYLYDYTTMEITKIIKGDDYYIYEAYKYKDDIYLDVLTCNEKKIMVYHCDTAQLESIYESKENIIFKGLINSTLYFNNKRIDCVTNTILDSNVPLEEDSKLVMWKDRIFILVEDMIVGYSDDELKTIHNYKSNRHKYSNSAWYYGEKLYALNWYSKRIYRVNSDKFLTEIDYPIKCDEDLFEDSLKDEKTKTYLVDDKIIYKDDKRWYEMKLIEGEIITDEFTGDTNFSEDVLYLNINKFESKTHNDEITSIIKEDFKMYCDNKDFIAYINNDNKLKVIDRKSKEIRLINEVNIGEIYLLDNYLYYDNHGTGIFRYNIITGISEMVLEGYVFKYIINENILYYIDDYFGRSLHMLHLDNRIQKQLTNDSLYVEDLLVVDNELYYVVYDKAKIIYKMNKDKSVLISIIKSDYFNSIFPINNDKIGYAHNGYIEGMIMTTEEQIRDVIYENDDICIFNAYHGEDCDAESLIVYYDKKNGSILKIENSCWVEDLQIYDDILYISGNEYDEFVIDAIDLKTLIKKNMVSRCDYSIASEEEYVAFKSIDGKHYILCNFMSGEFLQLQTEIDIINKIEDGYIYYTSKGKEYSIQIKDLTE